MYTLLFKDIQSNVVAIYYLTSAIHCIGIIQPYFVLSNPDIPLFYPNLLISNETSFKF